MKQPQKLQPILNVFGSSERILELERVEINSLLDSDISIGVNHFPIHYPNVDYWALNDWKTFKYIRNNNYYNNQKIITNDRVLEHYRNDKYWNIFKGLYIGGIIKNSAFLALDWAVHNNYDVRLYGIMDGKYEKMANGTTRYLNIFTKSYHFFDVKQYEKFEDYIKKNNIKRPLLNAKNT
jgi:hypothetical protein